MVGGGVRGKDVGIAHGTTTQVGPTIETSHLFMEGYLQAGGMITGITVGEGISGTTSEYLTNKFNGTGGAGKRIGIGRSNKLGVSRVCSRGIDHRNRLERCSNDSPGNKQERSNQSVHDHNPGRHHNNLNLDIKNLKEGKKKNRIEGRIIKGSPDHDKRLLFIKRVRVAPASTKGDLVRLEARPGMQPKRTR